MLKKIVIALIGGAIIHASIKSIKRNIEEKRKIEELYKQDISFNGIIDRVVEFEEARVKKIKEYLGQNFEEDLKNKEKELEENGWELDFHKKNH